MTQFEVCDNIHAWFVLIFEAQIVESIIDWYQLEKTLFWHHQSVPLRRGSVDTSIKSLPIIHLYLHKAPMEYLC